MTQKLESTTTDKIADAARELGYSVTLEPSRSPKQGFWPNGIASLLRSDHHKPDLLVQHGDAFVIVEARSQPVLLGGVMLARRLADRFDAPIVLCIEDDSFPKIPRSVQDYAKELNVRLSPLSDVGDVLTELLA